MAADVRNSENGDIGSSSSISSCAVESCSLPLSPNESVASSCSSISSLPSYIIVQRQMQDVVLTQQAKINTMNESKASFDMVMSSQNQKIKMLENTIMEDYVPKEMYDSLRTEMKEDYVPKENLEILKRNLQHEYESHSQAAAKLQETLKKLDASLIQVTALTKQMKADKIAFDSMSQSLRNEVSEIQAKNRDLESRLIEKTLLCDKQHCQIAQQQDVIEALQQKQQTQRMKYKHLEMEADVKKQQEVYLNQIFSCKNQKKI